MGGLGRIQAVALHLFATVASLVKLAGSKQAAMSLATKHGGHPILAKLITSSNPRKGTPGMPYQGYGHYPAKGNGKGATLLPLGLSTKPALEWWEMEA